MSSLPVALVGGVLLAVLGGGVITVASAAADSMVPAEINHRVVVEVSGAVEVKTDLDLDEFKPGQLIPSRIQIDGVPDGITVRVPVSVDGDVAGRVDGEHQVICTGCPNGESG